MNLFSEMFLELHASPLDWLDLQEELGRARSELPKSNFQPTILRRANEPIEDSIRRSLAGSFDPFSSEIARAAGARFMDGHWPQNISPEAIFFLDTMISHVLRTIAWIAPMPGRPLQPTIIPFPNASVSTVALWFMTEWWVAIGGFLYELEVREKHS